MADNEKLLELVKRISNSGKVRFVDRAFVVEPDKEIGLDAFASLVTLLNGKAGFVVSDEKIEITQPEVLQALKTLRDADLTQLLQGLISVDKVKIENGVAIVDRDKFTVASRFDRLVENVRDYECVEVQTDKIIFSNPEIVSKLRSYNEDLRLEEIREFAKAFFAAGAIVKEKSAEVQIGGAQSNLKKMAEELQMHGVDGILVGDGALKVENAKILSLAKEGVTSHSIADVR